MHIPTEQTEEKRPALIVSLKGSHNHTLHARHRRTLHIRYMWHMHCPPLDRLGLGLDNAGAGPSFAVVGGADQADVVDELVLGGTLHVRKGDGGKGRDGDAEEVDEQQAGEEGHLGCGL